MQLRPYQVEARDRILEELEQVRATLLVLATGLGKTVVFGSVAETFVARGLRVLVLAHRSELLEQAEATLERFGLTVGVEQGERHAGPDVPVVVASVQTLRGRRLGAFDAAAFGLVIVDEAHHTAARTYQAILEHFAGAKVLGVTATPDRTDGQGLKTVYASCAYRMELGAGIRAGFLAPVSLRSVVVEGLDLSDARVVAGELHQGELAEVLTKHQVLLGTAGPLAELAAGRQTVCFAAGVEQAHELAKLLCVRGTRAAAVDGGMSREARAQVLDDYRAGRVQVVVNAMLLTEGFDCPETSCIALVRPTGSRSLIAQMIGRGTRIAEGKDSCLVLDFVPERTASIRLAAPADVLAGEDLPADVAERVAEKSLDGERDLEAMIAEARAEVAAEHEAALAAEREAVLGAQRRRRDMIRAVGIAYAAHTIPTYELLAEVCPRQPGERMASPAQIEALCRMGFDVGDLTAREAQILFKACDVRRDRGLCTIKQSKLLARHGLRDDLSAELAREAITAIAENRWRAPAWLFSDPRFVRPTAA